MVEAPHLCRFGYRQAETSSCLWIDLADNNNPTPSQAARKDMDSRQSTRSAHEEHIDTPAEMPHYFAAIDLMEETSQDLPALLPRVGIRCCAKTQSS
ncbi:hypothetical protein DOTSEDRAFT_75943 [Dothistroma septosporum NZE10]|uniref:Uncharacterized protein n=1 Tax=Dothistroma septosporum (strain NZE10 / CBS 128990) TaxID=675120 RepID=N1PEN9_DOTSN|nr:hypothetical protein DOTSEDRAFT_75943 [Dothistroma septosporum NZE10]